MSAYDMLLGARTLSGQSELHLAFCGALFPELGSHCALVRYLAQLAL